MVNIKMVSLKNPCTACVIIEGLVRETLEKLQKQYPDIVLKYLELENLKDIHLIEGLEVEKFPALLVNDEQITAGTLPSKQQLVFLIEKGGNI